MSYLIKKTTIEALAISNEPMFKIRKSKETTIYQQGRYHSAPKKTCIETLYI